MSALVVFKKLSALVVSTPASAVCGYFVTEAYGVGTITVYDLKNQRQVTEVLQ